MHSRSAPSSRSEAAFLGLLPRDISWKRFRMQCEQQDGRSRSELEMIKPLRFWQRCMFACLVLGLSHLGVEVNPCLDQLRIFRLTL